ncbi:MAG TPA: hypothetical protein VH917_01460 [Ignavibacteriaceae bacterium]|jgi:hypothetical protein
MNADRIEIKDVVKVIEKDFRISDDNSLIPAIDSEKMDEFRKYLTEKLSYLLDNKYDTLINVLYRIDVNEEKLAKLFAEAKRESIPEVLADLIIERQIQKIRFRQKYKSLNNDQI